MKQQKPHKLDILAKALEELLSDMYGVERIGFALFMFNFDTSLVGDYLSNAEREDMIKFMRELADRLEKGEFIPRTIGEA
jgi:hypothetical protein